MHSVSSFLASSCTRRTPNILQTVERRGLEPHYFPGRIPSRSQQSPNRPVMTFTSGLPACAAWGLLRCSPLSVLFVSAQDLDRCTLPLLRHAPSIPHNGNDLLNVSQGAAVSSIQTFRSSAERSSDPTALRFAIAHIATSTS